MDAFLETQNRLETYIPVIISPVTKKMTDKRNSHLRAVSNVDSR